MERNGHLANLVATEAPAQPNIADQYKVYPNPVTTCSSISIETGSDLSYNISLHNQLGAKTLFATHYHELTELAARLPRLRNFNVAVREWNDQVVFLRKIVEGGTDKSYGIQVARLAGVPKPVIERAKIILRNLEESELTPDGNVRHPSRHRGDREKLKRLEAPPQLDLFASR